MLRVIILSVIMLSAIMLSAIMLSVIMPNVIILTVSAPLFELPSVMKSSFNNRFAIPIKLYLSFFNFKSTVVFLATYSLKNIYRGGGRSRGEGEGLTTN